MKQLIHDPEPLIYFFIIVILTIILANVVRSYFKNKLMNEVVEHHLDTTSVIFVSHLITTVIYLIGFGWALMVLPITKTFAHSLLAGAGVSSLILGFASQQLFTNLISGIYLIIVKPFKIGDTINFQNNVGKVEEINLNTTVIKDSNHHIIIIPSSMLLSNPIKIVNSENNNLK